MASGDGRILGLSTVEIHKHSKNEKGGIRREAGFYCRVERGWSSAAHYTDRICAPVIQTPKHVYFHFGLHGQFLLPLLLHIVHPARRRIPPHIS